MSKHSDSYASLIRGVSQQVPHDRLEGQHWEQVNMVSDPVRGLARRHGSKQMDAQRLGYPLLEQDLADASARREHTLAVEGVEYSIMHATQYYASNIEPIIAVNKDTGKLVKPFWCSQNALNIARYGITSVCAAGRFVLMSSAVSPVRHGEGKPWEGSHHAQCVWIRGGANSREFTIYATVGQVEHKFSYRTMAPAYEGALDTSDIPINLPGGGPDPEYAKKVSDRVNAYNTAMTQHLSKVAADITPANIAAKLAALMQPILPTANAIGPYVVLLQADAILTADDGGNGDLMRAVSREVTSAEMVSPRHYPGKVVKVVPKQANAIPYYLKAESVGKGANTAFGEVIWKEAAGVTVGVDWAFLFGVFKNGSFYVAETAQELSTYIAETVPTFVPSKSGDTEAQPLPEFFGRIITHMQMFQDRLMVVAGSTVFLSKSGDYLNFHRASMLAVADDDPIEVFAQGTEDDVITGGIQHDRNVILCGKRFQYLVPGRENMTPRNPFVGVLSAYEGANLVPHAIAGSLLFFAQRRERRLTVQQMAPGAVADRLDAFDITSQLDGYLTGTPQQIVAMTAPGAVFVRTREYTNGFYSYNYLDAADQSSRLFDSWSRWEFSQTLGVLVGITADDSGLLAVTVRHDNLGNPMMVLDRFTRETGLSDTPYLDSRTTVVGSNHQETHGRVVFGAGPRFLIGGPLGSAQELVNRYPASAQQLVCGAEYDSYVELTAPYLRDKDDKPITDDKLTVTKLTVTLAYSAALLAELRAVPSTIWKTAKTWISRPAGAWEVSTQTIAETENVTVPVMKDNTKYRLRLRSRNWLPLTVSAISWAGQLFTSRR